MKKLPIFVTFAPAISFLATEAFTVARPSLVLPAALKVGWVLNYQPGASITIQYKFGNLPTPLRRV